MIRKIALAVAAAALAAAAFPGGEATGTSSRVDVDTYITGKVLGRVPGKNVSKVEIAWAYKCFGDKLGDATYDWTLKLQRMQPLPRKTSVLGKGTSKRGSLRIQLAPGQYLPFADPFLCETERGAGSDVPEVGLLVSVPDYCAWSVTAARGLVQLEQGAVVKAAKIGSAVASGAAVVTLKGAAAALSSNGRDGTASVSASSRVAVQGGACARGGGWTLSVGQGTLTGAVKGVRSGIYRVKSPNAASTGGRGARWRVTVGGGVTRVAGLAGKVTVTGKKGAPVTLGAGRSTIVAGSAAPTKPR